MILQIIQKLNEGGAIFTYPIFGILFVMTFYFIKAIRNPINQEPLSKLIAHYGWFVIAWGGVGKAIGFIVAFDTLKTINFANLTAQQLAGGFRMVMICPLLAFFVFSMSRMFVLILTNKAYHNNSNNI